MRLAETHRERDPREPWNLTVAGPVEKDGSLVDPEVFAFMTTEPNALTASINHERMPVLISDPADFETWLSSSSADAFKLAKSYADEQMHIVQSGTDREDLLAA